MIYWSAKIHNYIPHKLKKILVKTSIIKASYQIKNGKYTF